MILYLTAVYLVVDAAEPSLSIEERMTLQRWEVRKWTLQAEPIFVREDSGLSPDLNEQKPQAAKAKLVVVPVFYGVKRDRCSPSGD